MSEAAEAADTRRLEGQQQMMAMVPKSRPPPMMMISSSSMFLDALEGEESFIEVECVLPED